MPPLEMLNQVLGPVSGALLVWILIKLTKVETKVEAIAKHEDQLKDHEKRLTLAEPKLKRAHQRCDEHETRLDKFSNKGSIQ